ncbi:hypothetical protein [Candidatus Clostridium radicumherbarum]|uniref:Uncharacterized protein n=1 Tax=Candidatus Clostridium radicumherbarum TaxID=3381662 RepID=A0ABW8TT12_9CLOT
MLYCDQCNYYKTAHVKSLKVSKCMCELTGFVFYKKPEEYNLEKYPCYYYELKTRKVEKEYLVAAI